MRDSGCDRSSDCCGDRRTADWRMKVLFPGKNVINITLRVLDEG